MSNKVQDAANVLNSNEVANNETQNATTTAAPKKTRKARTTKAKNVEVAPVEKIETETVAEVEPKERAPRVPKIDKVQAEICRQFEISAEQFWKFVGLNRGKTKMDKFADSLVHKAFFDREKFAEALKK